jgi:gas vesicle protein
MEDPIMRLRKENILMDVMLGAGVFLLDSLRNRMGSNLSDVRDQAREKYSDLRDRAQDKYGDLRDRAQDTYETVSDRVGRASEVLRGEDRSLLGNAAALLLGVGVGVGLGILLAPASGEETRSNLAEKVRDGLGHSKETTGTYGD